MGIYQCTKCKPTKEFKKPGTAFRISVDKRGFVMNIQCVLCGDITGTLDFKNTIDKRFKKE